MHGPRRQKVIILCIGPGAVYLRTQRRSVGQLGASHPFLPFLPALFSFLLFHPLLRRLSPPLCVRALSYSGVIGQFCRNLPRTVRASAALISTTVRRLKPVRYQQYLATPGSEKEIFMPPSDLTATAFLDESIRHLTILHAKTDISTNSHP
jgi:hypothetical protein